MVRRADEAGPTKGRTGRRRGNRRGRPDAVELPLSELHGCLDHALGAGNAAFEESVPEVLVDRLAISRRKSVVSRGAS